MSSQKICTKTRKCSPCIDLHGNIWDYKKDTPFVRFKFSIKKWNHLSYCFDYYPDGSIVRQASVYYKGIEYIAQNYNNSERHFYKKYLDKTVEIDY